MPNDGGDAVRPTTWCYHRVVSELTTPVAHDLAAVAHMSDAIAIMCLGKIVELSAAAEVALRPKHPYTQALFSGALPLDPGSTGRRSS